MKIGIFVSFGIGGADKATYMLAKGLKELGQDVIIFFNEWSIPKYSGQWEPNYQFLTRQPYYSDFKTILIENVNEFNNFNLDILNTHRSGEDFWLLPDFENHNFNFKIVETNFHGVLGTKADARIFPSKTLTYFYNINTNYRIIPNPIMLNHNKGNLRKELNIDDSVFIYGKNARPAIDIFSDIPYHAYKQIETDNTLFIQFAAIEKAIQTATDLELKNFICIDQTLDEEKISKFYNTIDVFCHSNSIGETFGNTIAEAMMHKKPVVSHFGQDSWPQAQLELLDQYNYYVVKKDDNLISNYAEYMNNLKINKIEYNNYSKYCYEKANNEYHYLLISKKYLDYFNELLL